MPRRGASITQADVARAFRVAKQFGGRVEIEPGGKIVIIPNGNASAEKPEPLPPLEPEKDWRL